MKASTSEGSPSSAGTKVRTGGFSPGMSTFGADILPGLTTFAMNQVLRASGVANPAQDAILPHGAKAPVTRSAVQRLLRVAVTKRSRASFILRERARQGD